MSEQRVSDEELARMLDDIRFVTQMLKKRESRHQRVVLDLADARARIAALEAAISQVATDIVWLELEVDGRKRYEARRLIYRRLQEATGNLLPQQIPAALATTTEQDTAHAED